MIYPDKYIVDVVTWVRDFVSQNPVTASVIVALIARLAKRYPWVGRIIDKLKAIVWRKGPSPSA